MGATLSETLLLLSALAVIRLRVFSAFLERTLTLWRDYIIRRQTKARYYLLMRFMHWLTSTGISFEQAGIITSNLPIHFQ